MNQTDNLYIRMKEAEEELERVNAAILKLKKEIEDDILNLSSLINKTINTQE